MRCFDLLDLPNLDALELAGGADGLGHEIFWVHVAEAATTADELFSWLKPGDFLILVGPFLERGGCTLAEVIRNAQDCRLSGLLVCRSPACPVIPDEICSLADEMAIPLFFMRGRAASSLEISYLMARAITEKTTADDMLDVTARDILFGYPELGELKVRRARSMGYELGRPHAGVYLSARSLAGRAPQPLSPEELHLVRSHFRTRLGFSPLMSSEEGAAFLLVPEEPRQKLVRWCQELLERLGKQATDSVFHLGVGSLQNEVASFRESIEEARSITEILGLVGKASAVKTYEDMIPHLMLYTLKDTPAAERATDILFGGIERYDAAHGTGLMELLKVYLQENANVSATAKRLYMHRNTLIYRLGKIGELSPIDLSDPDGRFKAMMGLCLLDLGTR